MNKYNLLEPTAMDSEIGTSKTCIFYDNAMFLCLLNKFAWFEFRLSLWDLATGLPVGEDIGIYSDACKVVPDGAVVVPYCEITLIGEDQPAGRFLKVKRNYLYRPEDRRVDFSVVRSEARSAFLTTEHLKEGDGKIELFGNLWMKIVSQP